MNIDDLIRERRMRSGSGLGLLLVYAVILACLVLTGMAIT